MTPPTVDSRDDYQALAQAVRANPKRFAFLGGGGSLNPMLHRYRDAAAVDDAVKRQSEQTAEAIVASGALGFGEIAVVHASLMPAHPFEEVNADHPLLLLLSDIAARRNVVIDLHLDLVAEPTAPRGRLAAGANPPQFKPNLDAFERLLSHNAAARIVWAHAGSDFIGHWTVQRSRALLSAHPNLYMSLRLGGGLPPNQPMQDGKKKGSSLSTAGLCAGQHVTGGHRGGNRL